MKNRSIKTHFKLDLLRLSSDLVNLLKERRYTMQWTTPSAEEMRFGFEVTMYVLNK